MAKAALAGLGLSHNIEPLTPKGLNQSSMAGIDSYVTVGNIERAVSVLLFLIINDYGQ